MPTDQFKKVIQDYLEGRAASDSLFAEKFRNEKKSVKDCCTYIINEVRKKKGSAFTDAEIFGLAVHFYDEEDIDPGKPVSGVDVVVVPESGNASEVQAIIPSKMAAKKPAEKKSGKPKKPAAENSTQESDKPKLHQGSLFDL